MYRYNGSGYSHTIATTNLHANCNSSTPASWSHIYYIVEINVRHLMGLARFHIFRIIIIFIFWQKNYNNNNRCFCCGGCNQCSIISTIVRIFIMYIIYNIYIGTIIIYIDANKNNRVWNGFWCSHKRTVFTRRANASVVYYMTILLSGTYKYLCVWLR